VAVYSERDGGVFRARGKSLAGKNSNAGAGAAAMRAHATRRDSPSREGPRLGFKGKSTTAVARISIARKTEILFASSPGHTLPHHINPLFTHDQRRCFVVIVFLDMLSTRAREYAIAARR